MTVHLVSRHGGAQEWLRRQGIAAETAVRADAAFLSRLAPGDEVIGNLPAPLVAEVNGRGATYRHILLDLSAEDGELSAEEMDAAGARLVPVRAWSAWAPSPPPAELPEPVAEGFGPLRYLGPFAGLVLFAFLLDAAFVAAQSLFSPGAGPVAPVAAVAQAMGFLVAASVVGWVLWRRRHRLIRFSIRRSGRVRPCRGVVVGLSPLRGSGGEVLEGAEIEAHVATLCAAGLERLSATHVELVRNAVSDPDAAGLIALRSPWQQAVRLLARHRSRLGHVVVVCSSESAPQFGAFRAVLESVLGAAGLSVEVEQCPGPPADFEDHEEVRAALLDALALCRRDHGIEDPDLGVDVTAGRKVFSIAAAVVTINQDLSFYYVNEAGDVAAYDAVASLGDG